MTWSSAKYMAFYFYPERVPEFDSKASVAIDIYEMAKKIVNLFPPEAIPVETHEAVKSYIRGDKDSPPEDLPIELPTRLSDSYYLLADFNFKNGDFSKARKYYKLDLCYEPQRFSSWVGIALALAKDIEDEIDSCQKIDSVTELLSQSESAIRCFKAAFRLSDSELNVWIELGSFAYVIHSFCKRFLNSSEGTKLNMESFEKVQRNIGSMLIESKMAFEMSKKLINEFGIASDEIWYVEYLLGKITEKLEEPPSHWLQHYINASKHLFDMSPSYQKKVSYNSPQKYAVESVEMHYRIHASILKYLLKMEGKPLLPEIQDLLLQTIVEMADSPFVQQTKKLDWDTELGKKKQGFISSDEENMILDDEADRKQEAELVAEEVFHHILSGVFSKVHTKELKLNLAKANESHEAGLGKISTGSTKELTVMLGRNDHWPLVQPCLEALTLCVSRFSQHFKSLYRIADYFYTSKFHQNMDYCRNALLTRPLQANEKLPPEPAKKRILPPSIGGLFSQRNTLNFFHGVWRIPVAEVNRSGNFAAQMSRAVNLCLEVLKKTKDSRTLLETAIALNDEPEDDKKYLNETEREEYSSTAFMYMISVYKERLKAVSSGRNFTPYTTIPTKQMAPSPKTQCLNLVMDLFRCYNRVAKQMPDNLGGLKPVFLDAYKILTKDEPSSGHTIRDALIYCRSRSQVKRGRQLEAHLSEATFSVDVNQSEVMKKSLPGPLPKVSSSTDLTKNQPHDSRKSSKVLQRTHLEDIIPRTDGKEPEIIDLDVIDEPAAKETVSAVGESKADSQVVNLSKLNETSSKMNGQQSSEKIAPIPSVSESKLSEISSVYSSMLAVSRHNFDSLNCKQTGKHFLKSIEITRVNPESKDSKFEKKFDTVSAASAREVVEAQVSCQTASVDGKDSEVRDVKTDINRRQKQSAKLLQSANTVSSNKNLEMLPVVQIEKLDVARITASSSESHFSKRLSPPSEMKTTAAPKPLHGNVSKVAQSLKISKTASTVSQYSTKILNKPQSRVKSPVAKKSKDCKSTRVEIETVIEVLDLSPKKRHDSEASSCSAKTKLHNSNSSPVRAVSANSSFNTTDKTLYSHPITLSEEGSEPPGKLELHGIKIPKGITITTTSSISEESTPVPKRGSTPTMKNIDQSCPETKFPKVEKAGSALSYKTIGQSTSKTVYRKVTGTNYPMSQNVKTGKVHVTKDAPMATKRKYESMEEITSRALKLKKRREENLNQIYLSALSSAMTVNLGFKPTAVSTDVSTTSKPSAVQISKKIQPTQRFESSASVSIPTKPTISGPKDSLKSQRASESGKEENAREKNEAVILLD
ncbi:uncharacterized protein LOC136033541 isoform X2 [Artemia franciscana]|uniref:uncharacterized protein LOC136033541 isoform X2 n=1 Tax=Artemia franciscana TaxID=6661 RepID=UPI0032D9B87B